MPFSAPTRQACRRARSWPPPPNWYASDWATELAQICALAALDAKVLATATEAQRQAFLYHRALGAALSAYRREWRFGAGTLPMSTAEDGAGVSSSANQALAPAPETDKRMAFGELRAALLRLPLSDRRLLVALYWERHTEREIAAQLGISQQAVSKRLHSCLCALRNWLTAISSHN